MVRRVVEEDVTTPSTTVIQDDGSWIVRTVVMLVVLALLVIGAVWFVRAINDNDSNGVTPGNTVPTQQNQVPNEQPS